MRISKHSFLASVAILGGSFVSTGVSADEVAETPEVVATENESIEAPVLEESSELEVSASPVSFETRAAEAENVGSELESNLYKIEAQIDPDNKLDTNDHLQGKNVETSLKFTIPNADNIQEGDYITFSSKNVWIRAENEDVKLEDGTVIGKMVTVDRVNGRNMYNISEDNKNNVLGGPVGGGRTVGQYWQDMDINTVGENAIYRLVFNNAITGLRDVNINYKVTQFQSYAAFAEDPGVMMETAVFDNAKKKLASKEFKPLVDKGVDYPEDDRTNRYMQAGSPYSFDVTNQTFNDSLLVIYNVNNQKIKDKIKAGTVYTWDFDIPENEFYTFKLKSFLDGKKVGDTIRLDSVSPALENGNPDVNINKNGVRGQTPGWNEFEILEMTDTKFSVRLKNDAEYMVYTGMDVSIVPSLTEVSTDTVDPETGFIKTKPKFKSTISYPDGVVREAIYDANVSPVGVWSNADGKILAKTSARLNGVLENGKVIASNMDVKEKLLEGTEFKLVGKDKIEFEGIWYVPKANKDVTGVAKKEDQTLNVVYVYSPELNHAFVDLTVNHVDKETGKVLGTKTTKNHEETTSYETKSESFNHYKLVTTPANAKGVFGKENVVVTYEYFRNRGSVNLHFKNEAGEVIADSVMVEKDKPVEITDYSTASNKKDRIVAKDGKTYDYLSVEGKETGKVVEGVTNVTYIYKEVKTALNVHLVDENGKALASVKSYKDLSTNVDYDTLKDAPEILVVEGRTYRRSEIPKNFKGKTTVDTIDVIYPYYEVKTAVITHLVDKNGNKLVPSVMDKDLSTGIDYDTLEHAPEILEVGGKQYRRIAIPDNSKGVTTVDEIEVIYVYELIVPEVPEQPIKEKSKVTPVVNKVMTATQGGKVLPNTGTASSVFAALAGVVTGVSAFFVTRKKK